MELRIERLRPIFDLLAIALAKRRVQSTHSGRNLVARLLIENIGFVAEKFLCMTQQELAVLNVSGGEHAAESYSINPICKSQSTPPAPLLLSASGATIQTVAAFGLLPLEHREGPMGLALIVN